MTDQPDNWETSGDAASWVAALVVEAATAITAEAAAALPDAADYAPDLRDTDIWYVRYYAGRYWHVNVNRKSGYKYPTMNHTLRGAFVCAPFDTCRETGTGVLPIAWYGKHIAEIQSFTWDKA